MEYVTLLIWGILALYVLIHFAKSVRLVPNRKAFIVERLGKYHQTLGPGFHVLLPFIDKVAYQQDLREMSIEVPPQEAFTADNVKVEVDGVLYISVSNPEKASYGVTDYRYAAIQLAQTTTRSVVGTLELDRTFEERDAINSRVVSVLDEVDDAWGIKVHRYEIKNIVPPNTVRDAMERQMGAERERRAVLFRAEGAKQSAINDSEGRKQELINQSEGQKARRINEAEGRAAEIVSVAKATAEGIRRFAGALTIEGGMDAIRLRLSQKYIQNLGNLAQGSTKLLVPADISKVDELLRSVGLDAEAAASEVTKLKSETQLRKAESRDIEPPRSKVLMRLKEEAAALAAPREEFEPEARRIRADRVPVATPTETPSLID